MLSAVAGIVDRGGGIRVVVGPRRNMILHRGPGEHLFIVPELKVQEPVPWGKAQADLIENVRSYVRARLTENKCGGCKQCCKTPYIKELNKPSHTVCRNCDSVGCAIYKSRPKSCKSFECNWLKSQRTEAPMAADLRPDKCGAMFTDDTSNTDPTILEVHIDGVMSRQAWQFIEDVQNTGRKAQRVTHYLGEK